MINHMDIGKPTKIYQNVNKFSLNCGNFDFFSFSVFYELSIMIHIHLH